MSLVDVLKNNGLWPINEDKNMLKLGIISLLLLAVGCQTTNKEASQTANRSDPRPPGNENLGIDSKPDTPGGDTFEGTAGITKKQSSNKSVVTLKAMRTANYPGYDRVVFEFQEGFLPAYHIEYIDNPVRQCGSGNVVQVSGDGWLLVRFNTAQAHNEKGEATVEPREQKLNFPIIREIEFICDFEGEVSLVLGVSSPNKYRVIELNNPSRLAIDVNH
jgi:hypothetical protein